MKCRHFWRDRNNPRRKCMPCRRIEARQMQAHVDAWIAACDHDFLPWVGWSGQPAISCQKCPLVKLEEQA